MTSNTDGGPLPASTIPSFFWYHKKECIKILFDLIQEEYTKISLSSRSSKLKFNDK